MPFLLGLFFSIFFVATSCAAQTLPLEQTLRAPASKLDVLDAYLRHRFSRIQRGLPAFLGASLDKNTLVLRFNTYYGFLATDDYIEEVLINTAQSALFFSGNAVSNFYWSNSSQDFPSKILEEQIVIQLHAVPADSREEAIVQFSKGKLDWKRGSKGSFYLDDQEKIILKSCNAIGMYSYCKRTGQSNKDFKDLDSYESGMQKAYTYRGMKRPDLLLSICTHAINLGKDSLYYAPSATGLILRGSDLDLDSGRSLDSFSHLRCSEAERDIESKINLK